MGIRTRGLFLMLGRMAGRMQEEGGGVWIVRRITNNKPNPVKAISNKDKNKTALKRKDKDPENALLCKAQTRPRSCTRRAARTAGTISGRRASCTCLGVGVGVGGGVRCFFRSSSIFFPVFPFLVAFFILRMILLLRFFFIAYFFCLNGIYDDDLIY